MQMCNGARARCAERSLRNEGDFVDRVLLLRRRDAGVQGMIDWYYFWEQCGAYALLMRLHLCFRAATDELFVTRMFGLQHNTAKGRLRLIAALAGEEELRIE